MAVSEPVRVQIELLGGIAVQRGGQDLAALRSQPKRVALLAYLLLRRDGGAVRRDELTGVFWPDATEARARASLRQAVRFLRLQLGADLVRTHGAGAVELLEDALECDALAVSHALARRDDRGAVEQYRGELLPGFGAGAGADFQHWLDGERERLRSGIVRAAVRLADAASARQRSDQAREWLARATELEPGNAALRERLAALQAQAENAAQRPDSPRVLVVQLENLTGDPSLDVLGRLAADTLAQGLAAVPDIVVTPPLALGHDVADAARRTGARVVVEGTYAAEGEQLQWQVRITDVAAARLLPGPATVAGSRTNASPGIVQLRDALVRTLAPALSTRSVHVRHAAPPPSVAAYAAYMDGLDAFVRGEWRDALAGFQRAVAQEPDYALPRVVSAIALWNLGELRAAKQAATEAARNRTSLSRFDGALLDMVLAWLAGDWAAAYRANAVQAQLAPTSLPHFALAEEARRLNRPREASALLAQMDPDRGELRGWIYYWIVLTAAHHVLGEHARELEAAVQCAERHAASPSALLLAARAHAALGDERAVNDVADRALTLPGQPDPTPGAILLEAALELRAHGHDPAGERTLGRALDWYREHVTAGSAPDQRRALARCLYYAGHLDEARHRFRLLDAREEPRPVRYVHRHLQAQLDAGYLLLIATRLGDDAEAERLRAHLRDLDAPFLFGAQWFWLAADAAARGEHREAIVLLRRAFANGLPYELFLHADPHFTALRGQPAFEALLRPQS